MSRARHAPAGLIDDPLAVFLDELSALRRHLIENGLGRPAEAHALWRHERTVHQDRVCLDRVEQRIVGERRIAEAEVVKRRPFPPQNLAHRETGASELLRQEQSRRRAFQIFDDVRLDP